MSLLELQQYLQKTGLGTKDRRRILNYVKSLMQISYEEGIRHERILHHTTHPNRCCGVAPSMGTPFIAADSDPEPAEMCNNWEDLEVISVIFHD